MQTEHVTAITTLLDGSYPSTGPGIGILITQDGLPLFNRGFGLACVGDGLPVTEDTLFDLASAGKHFTALSVLLLASRGLLSPNDDLRDHLDQLALLTNPFHRPVRIHDLVHHTSGLPDYTAWLDPSEYAGFTNDRLLEWLTDQEAAFAPGSRGITADDWDTYCNTNYALLACLVERVSGLSYPDFLRTEFFAPLGMSRSVCTVSGDELPGRAFRYGWECELLESPRDIPVYGDGNVYSTLADLQRWEAELSNPTLISSDWFSRAWIPGELDDGTPTAYAWGFHIGSRHGQRVAFHGGSWDGTSACITRHLDGRLSLMLVSCSQHLRVCTVSEQIERVVLGE